MEGKQGTPVVAVMCGLAVAVGAMSLWPHIANGQETAQVGDDFAIEEITVTSRRYEENIKDAPVSVSVMTGDYIDAQGIATGDDIIQLTPGATFIRFNKLQPEYSIRGVNGVAEGSSSEASVLTVIDNIPISKDIMKNPAMFDVQRVEVLRGPQGTSFGRNASAGLVHILSRRPTQEFSGRVTAGGGGFGRYETDGFLNVPLSQILAARLAFNIDGYDGYTRSTSTGKGLDGQKNYSVRGSFLLTPNERLSVYFKVGYNRDDDDTPVRRSRDCTRPTLVSAADRAIFNPPPPHPRWSITYFDPCNVYKTEISQGNFFVKRNILNLTGEIVYAFANGITVTTETGYLDGNTNRLQEAHGTPENVLWQRGFSSAHAFSQEARIDNQASGNRWRWLAGVYYLTDHQDKFDENQFFQNGAAGRPDTRDTKISSNSADSIGLFGEVTYDLTDRLNATFGTRWTHDKKDYQIAHTGFGWGGPISALVGCNFFPPGGKFICGNAANPVGFATPVTVSDSWSDVAFRGSLQYRVNDNHTVYALVSQGYKAGGFQPEPPNPTVARQSFNEETSTNYEIGWKGEVARRARFSIAAYFLQYKNLQLAQFIDVQGLGFFQAISNAGRAETLGLEFEGTVLVTRDFRLTGSFAVMDAQLKNTMLDTNEDGILESFNGFRPDNAPNWTATAVAEYDVHLPGGSVLTLRGDYRGRSNVWDDIIDRDLVTDTRLRPGVNIIGVSVTWLSPDGHMQARMWAKNLTQEKEVLNIGPPQPNTLQLPTAFGPPRRWGGTLSYRF